MNIEQGKITQITENTGRKKKMNDELAKIFSKILGVSKSGISAELSPDTVDSWDSLMQMKLVIAIEEHFKIELSEDEVAFRNFGQAVQILTKY